MCKNLSCFVLKLYGMTIIYTFLTYMLTTSLLLHLYHNFHHRLCTNLQAHSNYNITHTTSLHILYYTVSYNSISHSNTIYMDITVTPGSWHCVYVHFYIQIGSYFEQDQ